MNNYDTCLLRKWALVIQDYLTNIVHGKILTFLAPNLVMYQIYVENIEKVIHVEML